MRDEEAEENPEQTVEGLCAHLVRRGSGLPAAPANFTRDHPHLEAPGAHLFEAAAGLGGQPADNLLHRVRALGSCGLLLSPLLVSAGVDRAPEAG
jgi:hypothetical protein